MCCVGYLTTGGQPCRPDSARTAGRAPPEGVGQLGGALEPSHVPYAPFAGYATQALTDSRPPASGNSHCSYSPNQVKLFPGQHNHPEVRWAPTEKKNRISVTLRPDGSLMMRKQDICSQIPGGQPLANRKTKREQEAQSGLP